MAYFCIVAPIHILEQLKNRHAMGRYHLLLAHDVVEKSHAYKMAFDNIHPHPYSFVVMDNSVIELGDAVDLSMLQEACNIVRPSCVVLPDVLEQADATIDSCLDAIDSWSKILGPLMFCPQGTDTHSFTWCAEQLADDPRIKYWGCPRNLVRNVGSRAEAIKILHLLNPKRPIHMLGFSDDVIDDMLCAQLPGVYSIDSAVPLRCEVPFTLTLTMPARGDWWENGTVTDQTILNLQRVREWCEPRHAYAAA